MKKGIEKFEKEDYQGAFEFFQAAIRFDYQNIEALFWKGRTYAKLGKYELSTRIAREIGPKYLDILVERAISKINSKNYHDALSIFCEVLKIEPGNPDGLIGKSISLLHLYPYRSNERDLIANLIKFKPRNETISLQKAYILFQLNLLNEADNELREFLQLHPNHLDALNLRTNLLIVNGKMEEALLQCDGILKINGENIECLFNKGKILIYLKKYENSIEIFEKLLQKQPDHASALYYKAVSLKKVNKLKDSTDIFKKIHQIPTKNKEILLLHGLAYCQTGSLEKACEIYHELKDIDEDFSLKHTFPGIKDLENEIRISRSKIKEKKGKIGQNDSIDFPSSGNLMLEAISSFGLISFNRFNLALQILIAKKVTENYIFKNIRTSFIRTLESLGHCEFDFERRNITACPPSLVALPRYGERRVVLTGARTKEFVTDILSFIVQEKASANFHIIENVMPISYRDPCAPLVHLPSTIIITGKKDDIISQIATKFSLNLIFPDPACFTLTDFSIDIGEYRKNFKPFLEKEPNWESLFFDPNTLQFSKYKGELNKQPIYAAYQNPRNNQYTYVYWNNGTGSSVDKDWGRYLVLNDHHTRVMVYDPNQELLGVPATCPLPIVLSRAAALCSGKIPSQISYKYMQENDRKDNVQVTLYHEVPAIIAEKIAKKVGQDLLLKSIPMKI